MQNHSPVTWMGLEKIRPSTRGQTQKAIYLMVPLIRFVQNRQTHVTGSRLVVAGGGKARGMGSDCSCVCMVLFVRLWEDDENVQELHRVIVVPFLNVLKTTELCT